MILSCHDIGEGGVATAISEMTFKNKIGCKININSNLRNDKILFSETSGFILEVEKKHILKIKSLFSNYNEDFFEIGETNFSKNIFINNIINIPISKLKTAWENGLRNKLL